MKILFMMKHPGTTRNFESLLDELGRRGHRVHLAFEGVSDRGVGAVVKRLTKEHSNITFGRAPKSKGHQFAVIARAIRLCLDYLRYLEPAYSDADALRARAAGLAPLEFVELTSRRPFRSRLARRFLRRILRSVERRLPVPEDITTYLRKSNPDIMLITPLIGLGSRQAEHLRAAKRLGIRSGYCVYSWDNLSNMGLLRDEPDLVTVWNQEQAREAVELQRLPAKKVVVTGSSTYDHWFDWSVSRTREEFCAEVGLRADRPFILYVCSSPFIAPDEVAFVRNWIKSVRRANGGRLKEVGVLIRPHPQNFEQWRRIKLNLENTAIWPPKGQDPVDEEAKNEYFNSISHSAAVVGINTSALIESGIVGRPVFTILADEFKNTQQKTLHFHYLVRVAEGLLEVGTTMEEHAAQIADGIESPKPETGRAFVEAFVRPHGLETPATPLLADAIEVAATATAPKPAREPFAAGLVRRIVGRVARRGRNRASDETMAAAEALAGEKRGATTTGSDDELATGDPEGRLAHVKIAKRTARQLSEYEGQVIAGPWVAEVGYELLYWIPYLTWATRANPGLSRKLVIVSRGGTAHWYRHLSARYVDIFDLVSPERLTEMRDEIKDETRGYRKQLEVASYEEDLVRQVTERLEIAKAELLHPAIMFKAYSQLAKRSPIHSRPEIFEYHPMRPPEIGSLEGELPDDYVAVRFYFNGSFPDNEANRAFVESTIAALAAKSNVLLLNTSMNLDDHRDATFDPERVFMIDHLMTPTNNLHLQTVAISRARAFVGTYGGLSYLPPLMGVPSLAFYSDGARFQRHHLEIAQRQYRPPHYGDYVVLDTRHVDLLNLASLSTVGL